MKGSTGRKEDLLLLSAPERLAYKPPLGIRGREGREGPGGDIDDEKNLYSIFIRPGTCPDRGNFYILPQR